MMLAQTQVLGPRSWAREPGFGPDVLFWEGLQLKIFTSGPNPWFWAKNHGFGRVVLAVSINIDST